ncbi:aldo/keto reductase [Aurantimonas sp. VKM B-3413]|uniref:aldo/keto reductase n=1 Tax=Aurantimonas sp. VKM B-3413 TaxID=2779401 RepID=UPI001E52EED1|nr:aldo/keto reductase [Aurantimonas sp. VKM B-3413]MCB8838928.1 aldo/keto reductase [Aurantimonas sp. VKM B-3413]
MADQPVVAFHDGRSIPQVGLGVWQTPNEDAAAVVSAALAAGYRHIDTAAAYGNEEGVGEGIRASEIGRDEIFVTTKLWNNDQGYDAALKAFDTSLERLGLESVDLYLIHWPMPKKALYVETWKALTKLKAEGLARSIGVSNFCEEHLERIIGETGETPVLNQIELHPDFQQKKLRAVHERLGIKTESWSPLGRGQLLDHPEIGKIAKKHGRTAAQVIIRWHVEEGLVVIPKSSNPDRIRQNFDVFGFALDADDMAAIAALDSADARMGPDPMTADF